jgi:putative ABC transport system ATP-binding protein
MNRVVNVGSSGDADSLTAVASADPLASATSFAAADPVISIRALSKSFPGPPKVDVLRSIDLDVWPGEMMAILGSSGAGKSTLLNVLGCLDLPTSGSYSVDSQEVSTLNESQRCVLRSMKFGFVFQSFHLLSHRTVEENVMLSFLYAPSPNVACSPKGRRARRERSAQVLERVGLSHRREFLPTLLSGGERQRVAIARALVSNPRVIFCDEPTGNLDTATGDRVMQLFEALRADGIAVVVVTHDLSVAERCDRIVRIADGVMSGGLERSAVTTSIAVAPDHSDTPIAHEPTPSIDVDHSIPKGIRF